MIAPQSIQRDMRNAHTILVKIPEEKGHVRELGVDVNLILKWFLEKLCVRLWSGFIWLPEHYNELWFL
jgi:hypothetical protein